MPDKASNPERTKDGADVPEVAVGHCAYHEDFVTLRYHREQVAALTQEVATLKAERDMLRNANAVMFNGVTVKLRKHGDDGKHCWLTPTALYAEVDTLKAALATLRSELQKANEPKACPDCGRYPGERAIQIGDTSDDKSEGE